MANTFKNKITTGIGTTATTIYTAPASTTTTIIGITLANITNNIITADLTLTDNSTTSTGYIIKNVQISSGASFIPVGGDQKVVVLETGDYLQVTSNTAASIDAIVSVLEIN